MFCIQCKRLAISLPVWKTTCDSYNGLVLLRTSKYLVKSFTTTRNKSDGHSLVVSYLINSCGLSPETAISASQKINFQNPDKPISVLNLLRKNGFTNTHISKFVKTSPQLLLSDPQKTLLPKLVFFQSIGVSSADLASFIASNPKLLHRSLENQIIPFYNFLKSVILLDDKKIVSSLKNLSWFFLQELEKNIVPKIEVLRNLGVPASSFSSLVTRYPSVLPRNREKFIEYVTKVVEMGFDPSTSNFVRAVQCISGMSKSTWEHKKEVYRKNGWSEDEILMAFRRKPLCMNISEEKIMKVMDFLVNEMGWSSASIARNPGVLRYSLEKRIVPRCLLVKALVAKDLVKKDWSFSTVLLSNEKEFLKRFVYRYEKDVPELSKFFLGKVGLSEVGFESTEKLGMKQS